MGCPPVIWKKQAGVTTCVPGAYGLVNFGQLRAVPLRGSPDLATIPPMATDDRDFANKVVMVVATAFIAAAIGLMLTRLPAIETFRSDFGAGNTPKKAAPGPDLELHTYKVQPGDVWWKVARDHSVSTRALLDRNGADISTPLVPGQNVIIPDDTPPAPTSSARVPPH